MELIGRNYALKVLVPITIVFFLLPFDSFFVSDNETSLLFGKEAKAKTASRDDKSNVLQKNASWKNEIISAEDELHARSSQKFPMRTA